MSRKFSTENGFQVRHDSGYSNTGFHVGPEENIYENSADLASSLQANRLPPTLGHPSLGSVHNQNIVSEETINQTKHQVNEVVDIMKSNLSRVVQRETNLSRLESRSEDLSHGANQFQQQAIILQRKIWWSNAKYKIVVTERFLENFGERFTEKYF